MPGELDAELLGDPGNEGRRFGDIGIFETGDVPPQEGQVRVRRLAAHRRVLHHHLLFQKEAHEDGADEVAVELGAAVQVVSGALHELAEILPLLLRHADIGLPQVVPEVHGLSPDLELPLRLGLAAGELLRLGRLPLQLRPPLLGADKKAVKGPVEDLLLRPGLGVHRAQAPPDRGAVREIQLLQDLTGVRRLLEPHRQPLLPQQGGEGGELLHIHALAHHRVLGTFRAGRPWARAILSTSSGTAGAPW